MTYEQSRAQFEEYVLLAFPRTRMGRCPATDARKGEYRSFNVENAWLAWQAALRAAGIVVAQ